MVFLGRYSVVYVAEVSRRRLNTWLWDVQWRIKLVGKLRDLTDLKLFIIYGVSDFIQPIFMCAMKDKISWKIERFNRSQTF